MIEVELRTFISSEKYNQLLDDFRQKNIDIETQKQITYYFKGEQDFRLMLTDEFCKLWLKKGKLHDDAREELIVKVDKYYKDDLIKMLKALGYEVEIKWFRVRNSLKWKDVDVTIDYTHGYGYIMELELLVEKEDDIEEGRRRLKEMFEELNIDIVDKDLFKEKYKDYKVNWAEYTKDVNEDEFLKLD